MAIPLESFALIGDRRTLAMITKEGTICWYCPGRFDKPSLFASLLDEQKGGEWSIRWKNSSYASRDFEEDSAILQSTYTKDQEINVVVDFMPAGDGVPHGICRMLQGSSSECHIEVHPASGFEQKAPVLKQEDGNISIDNNTFFYSSHKAEIVDKHIEIEITSLNRGWLFLSEQRLGRV